MRVERSLSGLFLWSQVVGGFCYANPGSKTAEQYCGRSRIAAYAGDDLLLIFKVKSKNSRGEILSENDFKVKDSDYIAVYDKKLLWRANLYIDKPEKDLGDTDWNTAHPWTGKEGYGANEWNKIYDFSTLESDFNISKLAEGDGTQNIIIPNDSVYSYNGTNGTAVRKTVVYDWNGQDGPFFFNYKTDSQRKILGRFYNAQGDFSGILQNIGIFNPSLPIASPYMLTTAPGGVHYNYMHSGDKYTLDVLKVKDKPNPTLDSNAKAISGESLTLFGITYYPYVPALTNSITAQFGSPQTAASDITTGYTAGTDCVSFGQRSAGYENNKYTWPELGDGLWGKSWDQSQGYPYWNGYGIKIASWNDTYTVTDDNGSSRRKEFTVFLSSSEIKEVIKSIKINSVCKSDSIAVYLYCK
jgi:hypothetical protein